MRKLLTFTLLPLLLLTGCSAPAPEASLPELKVTFLDVGAADCIVLQADGHAAMIDTGNQGDAQYILDFLSAEGISSLDFLLLTHLDKDHIGSADVVMENIPIGTVYAPDYVKGNKQYDQYIAALDKLGIVPKHPAQPVALTFGAGALTLLPGDKAVYAQSNDYSILAHLTYGEITFLFAGDAEAERLGEYLAASPQPVDVLKVPHHGRKNALSEKFFTAVSPRAAVITCEKKDMPDAAVVSFLKSLGAKVYSTVDGTVTITTDGTRFTVAQ